MAKDTTGLRRGSTETEAREKEAILQEICDALHPRSGEASEGVGHISVEGSGLNNNITSSVITANAMNASSNSNGNGNAFRIGVGTANSSDSSSSGDNDSISDSSNELSNSGAVETEEGVSVSASNSSFSRKRKDIQMSSIMKSLTNLEAMTAKKQSDIDTARLISEKSRLQSENFRLQNELERNNQLRKTKESLQQEELINLIKYQTTVLMTLVNRFSTKSNAELSSHALEPCFNSHYITSEIPDGIGIDSSSLSSLSAFGHSGPNAYHDTSSFYDSGVLGSKRSKKNTTE